MAAFLHAVSGPRTRPALRFLPAFVPSPARFLPVILAFLPSRARLLPSAARFLHPTPTRHAYARCPTCSKLFPSAIPACTHCWNIFSLPSDISHHELLGLPYGPNPFIVDLKTLKDHFRKAQSICHPDSWASRAPDKQEIAHALSSRVNEAYQTLLKPLPRAEYILARNHLPMQESDTFPPEDAEFMSNIMETMETIEEADDSGPIEPIMKENDEQIRETLKELEFLIAQQEWPRVKAAAIRLRYLQRVKKAIDMQIRRTQ